MSLLVIFGGVVALFAVLLAAKEILYSNICVLCASISVTWIVLLVMLWTGREVDRVLLALFAGQSITGGYYLLRAKLAVRFRIFTLPFVLSATLVLYLLITRRTDEMLPAGVLVAVLWLAGFVVYGLRNSDVKHIAHKLIACCRDW